VKLKPLACILSLAACAGPLSAASPAFSRPLAYYGLGPDRQDVFWKSAKGEIIQAVWHVDEAHKDTWMAHVVVKEGVAAGPVGYIMGDGRQDLFWLGTEGGIHQASWLPKDNRWEYNTIVPNGAATVPAVDHGLGDPGRQDLFWPSNDGSLWQADWDVKENKWHLRKIVDGGVAPVEPATYHGLNEAGRQDVFYKRADGSLGQACYFEKREWKIQQVGGTKVDSAIIAYFGFGDAGRQDTFWRTPEGGIQQAMWDGKWNLRTITDHGARSEPAGYWGLSDGRQDLFWMNEDGTLGQGMWITKKRGWEFRTIGDKGMMASAPAAYMGFSTGRQDVFWVAPDGEITQAVWRDNKWTIVKPLKEGKHEWW